MFKQFYLELLIIIALKISNCYYLSELLQQYPFQIISFDRNQMKMDDASCSGYGLWSRYIPLSNTVKIGQIGILDSNCFHLHNAQDQNTQRINLILYECLNYGTNTIKKYLQFIDNNGVDHIYEMPIQDGAYEFVWYFIGFEMVPIENRFTIYFSNHEKLIQTHQIQIEFPFYDEKLNLIFGGDLSVKHDQQLHNSENEKLSYFPGQVLILNYYQISQQQYCNTVISFILSSQIDGCRCVPSQNTKINDQVIQKQEEFLFISSKTNCQQFLLSGWIKIDDIHTFVDEFDYQFIKLSGNFQVTQMTDDNLSPFTLTYKISSKGNQMIITTYSYTFPSINIDFSNNPYLIKQAFHLIGDIKLWHYLFVKKQETNIYISITFFELYKQEKFEIYEEVKQFNLVQFKLLYGNILQSHSDYLKIQIVGFQLLNCPQESVEQLECHSTCQECDGPTKTDCLSCFEFSNRKYLPDFKECICEYGTVDMNNQCITYESLNLTIVTPDEVTMQSCKYGYFEFDNACFRCPSTIMDNVVTCLECLQNPKEWMNMLYCETSLYSDDDGNISQYIYETDLCYKFVGNDLTYYLCEDECLDCQFFEEFNSIIQQKQLSSDKSMFIIAQITYCLPPYFLNFEKICTLCNIEFCLYCFSYFGNDQTKTTLNQQFQYSIIGEEIKTGCIQCIDGFIYSFEKEQCIYKNPAISNCLRSYLTAEGQEICIVSSIDDFNIAPEIINCQKHILKCKQCIQTPELIIKCIICEDGYMASAYSGICTECSYQINSKICVEWNQKNLEPWKWLIQGFRIQFLKITNFYHELVSIVPMSYVIQCLDGYQIILNQCYQYCDDNCQVCRNMKIDNQQQFYCQKCGLNYFKKNNRGQFQGKCINCPSLCQMCEQRSNDQIEKINPFFQINEENSIYTLKCIQKVPLQKVTIDPNLQIAHYCFNENCDDMFEYNVHFFCRTLELLDLDSYSGYLEQKLNYKYFNEIGLKRITLILLFNTVCENFQVKNYSFLNYIREKVFSIQQIKLRMEGQLKPFLLLIQFKILYFDSIKINQVMFLIRTQLKLILNNRGQSIDFNIVDTSFYSDQSDPIQIQIYGDNYRNFNLQNVQFFDVIVYNAIIFQIMSSDVGEIIKIKDLELSNCIFNNTTLLDFLNMRRQIIVDNLLIKSCHFYNSSIITVNLNLNQFADIIINNVDIQDSFFEESSFLYSYGNSTITINKFTLAKSSIFSSRIISFSKDFYFNEIILQENFFKEAQFLIQLSSSFMNSQIQINNFTIFKNQVSNFSAFVTEQKYERNKVNLKLDNFKFEDNIQDTQDYYSYLFKINCQTLQINDIELKGTYNFRFFSLIAIPTIKLENIIYENQQQQEKVAITFDCYKNSAVHSSLLLVSGFSNIILLQIQITNQFSIDQSIITIQSNPLINFNTVESILISHISFIGNILVKQNLGMLFSLIQIYSEKTQNIAIFNVIYKENIFHQYQADPSENSASLILIQSGQSKIMMTNIICSYNTLTNSSNSFISINSNSLVVVDFQAFHHNYFEAELWNKYYQVYIQSQYNLNQITLIINNAFKIETKSGALSITASNVNFTNGLFSYIIASSSLIFNINLQGQGIVIIKNCDILHAQSQSISTSKVDGAITINAKKSLLTIDIENLVLKEVQNTLSSSIFSIYPSSTINRILLNNIHAYNCFSLFNQFLYLEFDYKNVAQNEVLIQNLHIIQTDTAFMLYLQSIETVNPIEIQKITQDNAIINIIGCKVQMKGLFVEGIVSSGIIKIMDYSQIFFTNSLFQNISTFYPVNLLDFTQNNLFHSDLLINNISILNVNSFQYNKSKLNYFDLNIHLQLNQCTLIINEVSEPIQELVSINQFFEEILANSNKKGSLIHLNSITNQTQLLLRKIQFINNNCQHCWNGLLNFELTQIQVIKLSQFECILNFIKKHGCILAILENILDRSIIIDHSNFISNHGTKGTGVQVQNLGVILKHSRIINNFADEKGGGIYLNLNSNRFLLYQTLIYQNQAQVGGGVYLEGNSSLNVDNFQQSIILFNSANFSSNNINELPSHLALQLNYQEMHSQQQQIDNQLVQVLSLNPYKIISQNHVVRTNYLTVPSGQTLSNYQLYNPKLQQYISYFNEISIILKNSMNEQQSLHLINSSCNLIQKILDIKSHSIQDTNHLQSIAYDSNTNKFNMGQSKFNFDPYSQDDKIYEIFIECKTEYQDNALSYRMRVKSFFCQLGEFYISGSCQICQSDQGFYSVTYNTTKCSIFDKTKFEAITSNGIQLKKGYWRPNYVSDYIERCYKNTDQCLGGWSIGDNTCNQGYIGGLCEECDKFDLRGDGQYFKNQQQLECQQCQELSKRLIAFLLISFWAILSTLLTIRSIEKSNQLFTSLKLKQKFADILFNLDQDHESILLKLFLNYLWIFSLIFTFNIKFSFSLSFIKQSNDTSYFMANYFECFLSKIEGTELIYSRIIVTIGLILSQILIIYLILKIFSLLTDHKYQSRIISITMLYLYIQNYASLINQFFSILAVRRISQIDYIQGDVSLLYGSNTHIKWIFGFVVPGSIILAFILPFSMFIFLYFKKDKLNKIKYRRQIGYLFNEYTGKTYFWEWIKLWKKTIIIIILIYFETDIFLKASLLGFCLLIYQFLSQHFKPYILQKFNILDIQAGQLCSGAIFLAAVKYICEYEENYIISAFIQTIIILISLILSYPFVKNILKVYYKKFKPQILSSLLSIFLKAQTNSKYTKYLSTNLKLIRQKEENVKINFSKLRKAFLKKKYYENEKLNIRLTNNLSKEQLVLISVQQKSEN